DSGKPQGPPDPSGAPRGDVYGFSEGGFNRVWQATKRVEKELVPAAVGPRSRYPIMSGAGGIRFARLNATLNARAGPNTPSSAQATVRKFDGTNFSDGNTITVYNQWGSSIASGTLVAVFWNGRGWFVIAADC